MGQVNYMGGRLNNVKTRNKDTTLQIRKKHFGKQRFKTLSDYLQAINNPVPRVVSVLDPISKIGLAHARLGGGGGGGVSKREPSSDSSFSGQQRYRSYIPAPSKVSSESSDPLDGNANGASDTKLSTLRILRGLAKVEPASLDYQRKRLLETPDFAGLVALRKRRIEAAKTYISEDFPFGGSQAASTYGSDEDESMVADYGDTISEYSSLFRDFSGASGESIHSWNDERNIRKNRLSPSSSIRSFSLSTRHHGATSPILPGHYSHLNQVFPGSDAASIEDNDRTEDYAAQLCTSDSVISFSNERKLQRSPMVHDAIYDPLDIIMSDEWLSFSKMLDATLCYPESPSRSLSKISSKVPEIDSCVETWPLIRSDTTLGLDFHMFPCLLSERFRSQKNNIPTPSWERTQPPASHDEKNSFSAVTEQTEEHMMIQSENQNMRADPVSNSSYLTVTGATRRRIKLDDAGKLLTDAEEPDVYALSDIPSILLSGVPSSSDAQLESLSSNSDFVQRFTDDLDMNANIDSTKRDSRSQWDQLMKELLEPVPSSGPQCTNAAQISESNSNPDSDLSSHIAVGSSDMKTLQVRSSFPLQPLRINSSDDSTRGVAGQPAESRVAQNAETKPVAAVIGLETRNSGSGRYMDEGSITPGTENISGPILFAFTFTSDREDD